MAGISDIWSILDNSVYAAEHVTQEVRCNVTSERVTDICSVYILCDPTTTSISCVS